MKRFCLALCVCLTLAILFVSCGPPAAVDIDESKRCVPHSLVLDNTANNFALIAWNPGCPGTRIMRGFNIYLSPEPLVEKYPGRDLPKSIKPFNPKIYPGDTIGDLNRETYECKEIENATVYYAHVRVLYSDKTISAPTNEIEIVSWPQGIINLAVSYSGDRDGFSFAKNGYCRTDDVENDIYFYSKDGQDYLCSPSRLGPINRNSKIYSAGQGQSLGDYSKIEPVGNSSERIAIKKNGLYIITTEDGYPAKLRVDDITGSGDNRIIKFEYVYKPPVIRRGEAGS